MKRLTAILLVTVLLMTFLTGCGKKRELYSKVKLENYVEVSDYLGIEVDTTTDLFNSYYDRVLERDIEDNALYHNIEDRSVQNGDLIILDYVGKVDGVAFAGGTAKNAELLIGSKTFIDDFEEELVGVSIGETKDVTAVFPTPYPNSPDLAGKEAIFTCTVKKILLPFTVKEVAEAMNFDSVEDYQTDVKERAIKDYILYEVVSKSKIKDYPPKDAELLTDAILEVNIKSVKEQDNVDLEEVLIESGSSIEKYKSQISTQMVPQMMGVNMVMYYILDTEKLELLESTVNSQSVDQPIIAESYAVQDIVMEYLYDNAKIK